MSQLSSSIHTEFMEEYKGDFEARMVKVYIRTVSRRSIKIELPAQIAPSKLKRIIWDKLQIPISEQMLYLKGVLINFQTQIMLEDNWIVHVIDLLKVELPTLEVQIKTASLGSSLSSAENIVYRVDPRETIVQFLKKEIVDRFSVKLSEVLLVESGRFLKCHSTFLEQHIQTGTTINLIHSQNDRSKSFSTLSPSHVNKGQKSIPSINLMSKNQSQHQENEEKSISLVRLKSPVKKKKQPLYCETHRRVVDSGKTQEIYQQKTQRNSSNSDSVQSPRSLLNANKSIPIGQRQCKCNKRVEREGKFITTEERKRREKQIREQNLKKLMMNKSKQKEMHDSNQNSVSLTSSEKIALKRMKSHGNLQNINLSDSSELDLNEKGFNENFNPESNKSKMNQ